MDKELIAALTALRKLQASESATRALPTRPGWTSWTGIRAGSTWSPTRQADHSRGGAAW
jgi:hypothetical protein